MLQQFHLMVALDEDIIPLTDFQRASVVVHQHLARIDIDEDVDRHPVFRQHLVRHEATIHDVPIIVYL